jgi:NADPH2:quinone reductase
VSPGPDRYTAVVMDAYGGPAVLEAREVAAAPLGAGEIVVRTVAAAVNRADVEIRSGNWPIEKPDPFPYTPGLEVIGDVIDAALDVTEPLIGARVVTMMQRLGGIYGERPGGYAEFVRVPAGHVAEVPTDLDPFALAALGLAGVTALEGLRRLDLAPGQHVVVLGASGGVGSAAVGLAAAKGAHVIAVLPTRAKEDYVRGLGAAQCVSLAEGRLVDQVGARTVDAVLETVGEATFRDSVASLRRGGRLCLVGALSGPTLRLVAWDLMQDLLVTGYSSENLTGPALREDIAALVKAYRSGGVRAPNVTTFPLRLASEAHRAMEEGRLTGRALLVPAGTASLAQ